MTTGSPIMQMLLLWSTLLPDQAWSNPLVLVGEGVLHPISFQSDSKPPQNVLVYVSEPRRFVYFQRPNTKCLLWFDTLEVKVSKNSSIYKLNHDSTHACDKHKSLAQSDAIEITTCKDDRCSPDADYQILFLGPGKFDDLHVSGVPYFGGELKLSDRSFFRDYPLALTIR